MNVVRSRKYRDRAARSEQECRLQLPVARPSDAAIDGPSKRRRTKPEPATELFQGQRLPLDILVRLMVVGGAAVAFVISRTCKALLEQYRLILQRNSEALKDGRARDLIPLRTDLIDACLDDSGLWEDVLIRLYDDFLASHPKPRVDAFSALCTSGDRPLRAVSLEFNRFLRRLLQLSPLPRLLLPRIVERALLVGKTSVLELIRIYQPQGLRDITRSCGIRGALYSMDLIKYLEKLGHEPRVVIENADSVAVDLRYGCLTTGQQQTELFPDLDGAVAVLAYTFDQKITAGPPGSMLWDRRLHPIAVRMYARDPLRVDPMRIYGAVFGIDQEESLSIALRHWAPTPSIVERYMSVISRRAAAEIAKCFTYEELRRLLNVCAIETRSGSECFYGLCIGAVRLHPGRTEPRVAWHCGYTTVGLYHQVCQRITEAELLAGHKLWDSLELPNGVGLIDSDDGDSGTELSSSDE